MEITNGWKTLIGNTDMWSIFAYKWNVDANGCQSYLTSCNKIATMFTLNYYLIAWIAIVEQL